MQVIDTLGSQNGLNTAGLLSEDSILSETIECRGIHQLFERTVAASPTALAVTDSFDGNLTYGELNRRANQLANRLRAAGVKPDDLVAVSFDRSVEMAVAIVGILKSGGAYVPLDPGYPMDRLAFMLEDSGARTFVTLSHIAPQFEKYTGTIVCTDLEADRISSEPDSDLESFSLPNHLAYVIYTSGTTGRPKGVMITHNNLYSYVRSLPAALGIKSDDRYLHTASISFSSSVRQLMVPLSLGAAAVIASSDLMRDPLSLFEFMKQKRITVLDFVPSFWRTCIYAVENRSDEECRQIFDNSVRLLLSASEPLPAAVPPALASKFKPGVRMINMYGQTETTGIISVYPIDKEAEFSAATVPIGLPITNTSLYILNDDMTPVSDGAKGELFVGGPDVGRGYLNQPELSGERFIADPFARDGRSRLYRTGDLARRLPTGEIEHLGRFDNQIKIRGFRVEVGEIESTAALFPEIREAIVTLHEDEAGNKRLVAYFVSQDKSPIPVAELRAFLRTKLPDYMIPSSFVQLDRLPLTPNGKVDRKALPAPDITSAAAEHTRVPRSETEKTLAKVWSKLLGVENIGIDENFFDLGGHSLLAVQMFTSIEEVFHKNIPLATLFGAGTIEKLSEIIDRDDWQEPESSLVAIKPNGTMLPFYCMHAVGGNVLFYSDLAKYLDADQPLYGLQARRLAGRQIAHPTIEEMVEFYIKEIKKHQPVGPYCIGGSSFGGLVAYEMARQLHALGDEVGLLALFDTSTPEYKKTLVPGTTGLQIKVHNFLDRVQLHKDNLNTLGKKDKAKYVFAKGKKGILKYKRNFNNSFKKFVRKLYTEFKGKRAIPKNYIYLENQLVNARKIFRPKPYPGSATLFRATNQPYGLAPEPTLGWKLYVDDLEIREVPGHHTSIIAEPYVRGLARELTDRLARVHSRQDHADAQPQNGNGAAYYNDQVKSAC